MYYNYYNTRSLLNANTLELHYWLNDDSHTMDAYVHNECESEFLSLIKEVAATFNLQITVETEALATGGVRRWFKVISKTENRKAIITTALITTLIASILSTPITSTISEVTKHVVDSFFEDPELKELEKEKMKLEIQNLKLEVEYKKQKLNTSKKVLKRKSNFFEKIDKYPKIQQVSIIVENVEKVPIDKEILVKRENFQNYILASDELDDEE